MFLRWGLTSYHTVRSGTCHVADYTCFDSVTCFLNMQLADVEEAKGDSWLSVIPWKLCDLSPRLSILCQAACNQPLPFY